jgi:hypothetical protein
VVRRVTKKQTESRGNRLNHTKTLNRMNDTLQNNEGNYGDQLSNF